MIRLHDVLTGTGGKVAGQLSEQFLFTRVVHDSRYVERGDLFVALVGETNDGHNFIPEARERGAAAALVDNVHALQIHPAGIPLIVVKDTLLALQALARYWRGLFSPKVVGITGSIGKSSTKEVIGAVAGAKFRVAKSARSFNNEVGLPLSVLEITPDTDVVVLELGGAYAFGEISFLCEIARPTIGVVTNVSHSHLGRMGSLEAIAETKTELVEALPESGVAVLNIDDPRVWAMRERTRAKVVSFGLDEAADLRAIDLESRGIEGISFTLVREGSADRVQVPLMGRHSVHMALAGMAVGFELGMALPDILRGFGARNVQLRLLLSPGVNGSTLLDDTYNANPQSSFAALALLAELDAKRRVAVFGDMLELGEYEEEGHRLVGGRIAEVADAFYAVGPRAAIMADEATRQKPELPVFGFEDKDSLVAALRRDLRAGDLALVKGSRGIMMETVVAALRAPDAGERDGG